MWHSLARNEVKMSLDEKIRTVAKVMDEFVIDHIEVKDGEFSAIMKRDGKGVFHLKKEEAEEDLRIKTELENEKKEIKKGVFNV